MKLNDPILPKQKQDMTPGLTKLEYAAIQITDMDRESKNHQAYEDCANYGPPSWPDDEEYMQFYRGWRAIAMYPEDQEIEQD